jgi:hypothetical protein
MKTAENDRSPDLPPDPGKPLWIVGDSLKVLLDGNTEFATQSLTLALIPCDGFVKLQFGNPAEDEAALHLRYFASSFALTSSRETTSFGFSRCSWRRRSIISASPGVSSSEPAISSHRLRHSSICSARGSARASLRTMSELMATIYNAGSAAQVEFFTTRHTEACKTSLPCAAVRTLKRRERRAPAVPERGCVRSTSRSTPDISYAPGNHRALRLDLRPQPRSFFLRSSASRLSKFALTQAGFFQSRITHRASGGL